VYPTLRYGPPGDDAVIDVLTRLGTAFAYEDLEAETIEIEGVRVRIATPATLVRMKRNTIRPIDKADAAALSHLYGIEGPVTIYRLTDEGPVVDRVVTVRASR
jgi:hypothetical protein